MGDGACELRECTGVSAWFCVELVSRERVEAYAVGYNSR